MKHYFQTISVLFILLFSGCEKNLTIEDEMYSIKFGSECGWCEGQEYIIVTSSNIDYVRTIPCGDNADTINKSMEYCPCEWSQITSTFDYSLFKTLEYTDCNVCVDGCDEIIQITEGDSTHELRYSFSDEVEGMENLRNKLNELMETMRNLD